MLIDSFAPKVSVPAPLMVWAVVPFMVIVAALAALKLSVWLAATEILPFKLKVPVMPPGSW